MLDLERVDLDELSMALEDHSPMLDGFWMFDPRTGETQYYSRDAGDFDDADDLDPDLLRVESLPSSEGYQDMVDFIELVPESRPADLLSRAIEGRGAFRRFKDTLFEFPELRQQWFAFRDTRMRHRALAWLAENGVIGWDTAEQVQASDSDPAVGGTSATLARRVADDLQKLYGERLVQVVMYGSRARGDQREESDLDLLVVLDQVDDWSAERDFMDEVIWHHTYDSGVLVSAQPVSLEQFDNAGTAFLRNVKADGVAA